MSQTSENPMGTDGFEFVEYAAPDPAALDTLFRNMGFVVVARHRSKDVTLYRQGGVNFILNAEADSFAQAFARIHGPSVCAMAFRVSDSAAAMERATGLGAKASRVPVGPMELNIPAIHGIGDSLIYLVDRYGAHSIYDVDFVPVEGVEAEPRGVGLFEIDHLTHNVHQGRMNEWAEFYERLFNFHQIRFFDIKGKASGLRSRAMTSPCGKIRIPINESSDDKSQIEEYLAAYNGEGIQHIALASHDIHASVETMSTKGIPFLTVPPSYYEMLEDRLPGHGEDLARIEKNHLLIDGNPAESRLLLQLFTETVIGPIFFELIQRKGEEGFGEGNFQALFEAMERDQIARGALKSA